MAQYIIQMSLQREASIFESVADLMDLDSDEPNYGDLCAFHLKMLEVETGWPSQKILDYLKSKVQVDDTARIAAARLVDAVELEENGC